MGCKARGQPGQPFSHKTGHFHYAHHLKCHCGDSSSNGAASSSVNHSKRRLDAQERLRQQQKNVSSDW